jgi:hypothetical protein
MPMATLCEAEVQQVLRNCPRDDTERWDRECGAALRLIAGSSIASPGPFQVQQGAGFSCHGCRQSVRAPVPKWLPTARFDLSIGTLLCLTAVYERGPHISGLDIPKVELVLNYNLPAAAKEYIHRVGRTARAGVRCVRCGRYPQSPRVPV